MSSETFAYWGSLDPPRLRLAESAYGAPAPVGLRVEGASADGAGRAGEAAGGGENEKQSG
jgi:hypothetical protein